MDGEKNPSLLWERAWEAGPMVPAPVSEPSMLDESRNLSAKNSASIVCVEELAATTYSGPLDQLSSVMLLWVAK